MIIHNAAITGSLTYNGIDISDITGSEAAVSGLNQFSGSINTYTGSMNLFTQSVNTTTASLSGSIAILSGSYLTTSASYASASGSLSRRTTNLETTSSVLTTVSASFAIVSSSFATTSASLSTRTTNLETTSSVLTTASASFAVVSSSFSSTSQSIASRVQVIETSYATTGSNIFTSNQTICGNLTTTGAITAQTINVQQVTSSIVYSSGSNIFGNQLSNTQQFTGSMFITGSTLTVTGGTICATGNSCIGGSTVIAGCVGIGTATPSVNGLQVSRTGDAYLRVQGGSPTYTGFDFLQGTDGVAYVWNRDNKEMLFGTNNTERMRITSTGIACFAGTVCAPTFIGTTNINTGTSCIVDSHTININGDQASVNVGIVLRNTNATYPKVYGITNVNNNLNIYDYTANSQRLRIDTNGVACFACQVCVPASNTALFVGSFGTISNTGGIDTNLANNAYYDGANWRYIASQEAGRMLMNRDTFIWYRKAAGIIGNIITWDESMRISSSGCVGIGTSTPDRTLSINGDTSLLGNNYISTSKFFQWEGAAYWTLRTISSGNQFEIYRGDTGCSQFVISSTNNIGIGMQSPLTPSACRQGIQMSNSTCGGILLLGNNVCESCNPRVFSTGFNLGFASGISTGTMDFYTNDSVRLSFTSTGIACFACQVCAPRITIPVARISDETTFGLTICKGPNGYPLIHADAGQSIGFGNSEAAQSTSERLRIFQNGIACFSCQVCAPGLRIQSAFANLTLCGSNTTAPHCGGTFLIDTNQDGNGRTIIGNSVVNRAMYLEANGNITFNCTFSAPVAIISGCVGIGTTNPNNKLEVIVASNTSAVSTSGIAISDGAANRTMMFLGVNTNNYAYIQGNQDNVSSKPLVLQGSGGNVGIGTTSPKSTLHVAGTIGIGDGATKTYSGTGDLDITVSELIALNGNTWRSVAGYIMYSGVQTDQSNQTDLFAMFRLRGLSCWNAVCIYNIVGTTTLNLSNGSTTGVTMTLDVGNSVVGSAMVFITGINGSNLS